MKTKSQAAMEFLMTYGWALLVVLIVIAALVFFGLLNPDRYTPDKAEVEDKTIQITPAGNFLIIKNIGPKKLYNVSLNFNNGDCYSDETYNINSDNSQKYFFFCPNLNENDVLKSDIEINYFTQTEGEILSHSTQGDIKFSSLFISTDELVGFWRFEGNGEDSSKYENHGAEQGAPEYVQGKVGTAIDLDGMADYLHVLSFNNPPSEDMTLLAWIKPRTVDALDFDGVITSWNLGDGGYKLMLRKSATEYQIGFGYRNSGGTYADKYTSNSHQLNEWIHVAATLDGSAKKITLYINGQKIDESIGTDTTITQGTTHYIGWNDDNGDYFDGLIDELIMYSRTLTDSEIKTIYAATS
jgi:hypothetical protein